MLNIDDLRGELAYASALSLTECGDLEAAESTLLESSICSEPKGLDLLARIHYFRGDSEEAEKLWDRAVAISHDFEPSRNALTTLKSPWLFHAIVRRLLVLTGLALIICAGMLVTASIASYEAHKAVQNRRHAMALRRDGLYRRGQRLAGWRRHISIPGCIIADVDGRRVIVFEKCLFCYGCELSDDSAAALAAVAAVLEHDLGAYDVVIAGHSNKLSAYEEALFGDWYTLGMHRAVVVADVLRIRHGVAGERMSIRSLGIEYPPFPDEEGNPGSNNDTVTIELVARDAR